MFEDNIKFEDKLKIRKQNEANEETINKLRALNRKQSKSEVIRVKLSQALSECGDGEDFRIVREAIKLAISKLSELSEKNQQKFKTSKQMLELSKQRHNKWWETIKSGLGIPPEIPKLDIKKENIDELE